MTKKQLTVLWSGVLIALIILLTSLRPRPEKAIDYQSLSARNDSLQQVTYGILDAKCNVCHRKKNPFMVFNQKKMVKQAKRIYKAVFIAQRMPKGDKIRLTNEEYATLKKWLSTQKIF